MRMGHPLEMWIHFLNKFLFHDIDPGIHTILTYQTFHAALYQNKNQCIYMQSLIGLSNSLVFPSNQSSHLVPRKHAAEKFELLTETCPPPNTRRWCEFFQLVITSRTTRARQEPAFLSNKWEHRKTLFDSYMMHVLFCGEGTLLLVLTVILKSRQERCLLCAIVSDPKLSFLLDAEHRLVGESCIEWVFGHRMETQFPNDVQINNLCGLVKDVLSPHTGSSRKTVNLPK